MTGHCTIVALGGNAFVQPGEPITMAGQFAFAESLFEHLVPLFASENRVVITHGNGPQVGQMLTRVEESAGKAYSLPLEVCVAESEGELGYVLQRSLSNVLRKHGLKRSVVSVLTQVVVDEADPAFEKPSKPIGLFYSEEQAAQLRDQDYVVKEDSGRGYRRVVPSPAPQSIAETAVIWQLTHSGVVVVAAGGGGIPVVERDDRLCGIEAVVDKDLSSALLGQLIDADQFLILTDVACAYRDFGTPAQKSIGRITPDAATTLVQEGHFAAGSMLPKVEAAIRFARRPGCRAVICDIGSLPQALSGQAGTIVERATGDDEETGDQQ